MISLLDDNKWLQENKSKLINLLPETWTHMHNLNGLQLGFQFKLLGLDWRSQNEFAAIMIKLEKLGIMKRKDYLVRRSN